MSSKTAHASVLAPTPAQHLSSLVSRFLKRRLAGAAVGRLTVVLPSGERIEHHGYEPGPEAELRIASWRALVRLFANGYTGFARAYIAGEWRSPDIAAFLEWAACNTEQIHAAFSGNRLSQSFDRLHHLRRTNTKKGSRRNISAHYDLGNVFYALWLDESMNYSSGLYSDPGQSLEEAQSAKMKRVAELLTLRGGERVLEIGCGWGAMVEHLVSTHRCEVTGLTLSSEQRDFAVNRFHSSDTEARDRIRLQDYRDENAQYDRIVSIEMLEAVGKVYWPQYFNKLRSCLKPGGVAVLQSITIADSRFEAYRRNPDFIQRFIFPGGMLPTVEIIRRQIAAAGLCLRSVETFGQSYALTLGAWHVRFQQSWPLITRLGFDERFKRMWEYYLTYCEAGFRAGLLDVGLYKIVHAGDA